MMFLVRQKSGPFCNRPVDRGPSRGPSRGPFRGPLYFTTFSPVDRNCAKGIGGLEVGKETVCFAWLFLGTLGTP